MNVPAMLSLKRTRTSCMLQQWGASELPKQVPQVHLNQRLPWQQGHSFVPLHQSLGLPRRKPSLANLRRCIARLAPLPYPRGTLGKEAPQDQKATSHALIATRPATGPGNALIPRRVEMKIRAIRNSPMLRHALGMCAIQPWRRFSWERLLPPVCFS